MLTLTKYQVLIRPSNQSVFHVYVALKIKVYVGLLVPSYDNACGLL